jgi:23S rRNA (guanosine2251-2'-O)-methyltransferase
MSGPRRGRDDRTGGRGRDDRTAGRGHQRDQGRDRGRTPRGESRDLGQQVEGRRAVRELLVAGTRRVHDVWVSADADSSGILAEIGDLARDAGVTVKRVDAAQVLRKARTEAPQGVVAFAAPLVPVALDDVLAAPGCFAVALDGVTDPQNLGAVLRSAEVLGATAAILPRHRAVGITPAVAKAAAGAIEHLPIAFVGGVPNALEQARRAQVWCVGLDADGDQPVFDVAVADQPILLVLGAEGRGLARLTRSRCDAIASIPMLGRVDSLNVSAAAAIACAAIARARAA